MGAERRALAASGVLPAPQSHYRLDTRTRQRLAAGAWAAIAQEM
jgi:hypothetical protein